MSRTMSSEVSRTLVLGLPLVGSQVAHMLVGLTDTIMLGWYSVSALAAVTLGASFWTSVFVLGSGFAHAVLPMAAEGVGQGDETRVRRVARMGLWLSLIFGAVTLPLFFWSGAILLALGQEPQVAEDAQTYLRIASLGLIPALLTATLRSHLSALEHARIVLWATLSAVALNAAMNWLLIFGNYGFPELGLRGAAIASVGVHVLTTVVLLAYATRGPDMARFELLRNIQRPDWPIFSEIFRLGWPIGLTILAETGLFVAGAVMMGWIGMTALAAHGVAIHVAGIVFMVHLGLASAETVRVGQAWGRRDRDGLIRATMAATLLSGIAVVVITGVYLSAGEGIVSAFVRPSDPQAQAIIALGAHLLVLAALFQLVDAGQVIALGALRGIQDTRRPMVYAIVSYWLCGVPSGYVLAFVFGMGPTGIWLGLTVGLAVAAVALTARLLRLTRAMPEDTPSTGVTSRS